MKKLHLGKNALGLGLALFLRSPALPAADWPHWLGPNGDNLAPAGDNFNPDLDKWKVAWHTNVGLGYSSVAVAGGRAITLGHDGKANETVYCLDAATGALKWKQAYPAKLMDVMHPGGPNATATFTGDRVITLSTDGQAFCFSADSGAKIWAADLVKILDIELPQWGLASSPVVLGNRVLFSSGRVAALDLATGKTVWTTKEKHAPAYTTTVPFEQGGKHFIAALDGEGLSILTASDGAEVARHPFKSNFDLNATTPFVLAEGKRIFVTGNTQAEMLGFDGKGLAPIWSSTDIKNSMDNSVILNGVLYGVDGPQYSPESRMVSVNVADGKLNWAKESFGFGNTIGIGNYVLAINENGELVTVKPGPARYEEISRLQVLGKKCWTTPTYASGRIYVRNDKGDVVCLSPH